MKEIEGLVCVGRDERIAVLYGKSVHIKEQTFEAFNTNDLTPFDTPSKPKLP